MSAQPLGHGDILRARHAVAEREREDADTPLQKRIGAILMDSMTCAQYASRCVESSHIVGVRDDRGRDVGVRPEDVFGAWLEAIVEKELKS